MSGILAVGPARAAADVYVLQDGTPLVSKPGIGGKILLWVDTGFPLTVLGREGEWLEVSSSRLKSGGDTLWVPAARVGSHLPGTVDIAYSQEGPSTLPDKQENLLLEVVGTRDIRIRIRCRIAQSGKDGFIDVIDETPLQLDISGPAADCTVRNLGAGGAIDALLWSATGQLIARASTYRLHGAVRVRTNGPWGIAAGFVLPTRFVVLKDISKIPFPPGIPVPPLGNPMPAFGNPVPSFQQPPVPSFQQPPVPAFRQSPVPTP